MKLSTIVFAATCMISSVSIGADLTKINVLRLSPPGSNASLWTSAFDQILSNKGYSVNIIGFKNCQEGAKWLRDNPSEPVLVQTESDALVLAMAQPNNPAGCNFQVNDKSLVSIAGKWFHILCGHAGKNDSIKALLASQSPKVGTFAGPVQMKIVKEQFADMGVHDAKLISYSAGKDMRQAMASGDIDYIIWNSETILSTPGTSCFATSAPPVVAKTMGSTGRTSYQEVNNQVRHLGSGQWPVILSYNTNISDIRKIMNEQKQTSPLLMQLLSNFIPVNDTIDQQLKNLNSIAKKINE